MISYHSCVHRHSYIRPEKEYFQLYATGIATKYVRAESTQCFIRTNYKICEWLYCPIASAILTEEVIETVVRCVFWVTVRDRIFVPSSGSNEFSLKMGRTYGYDMLVNNQRKATLGNNQKVTSYCNPGGSLKSHRSNHRSEKHPITLM
jgi:hypothetical protein